MGLDAVVACNCYRQGKTKPFPLPEYENQFGIDADGRWGLLLPYSSETDLLHKTLYIWGRDACEHEGMVYMRERVSNWSGYRLFQQALDRIGWEHFPTLKQELPEANGGFMPATSAGSMLRELEYFGTQRQVELSLVNAETNEVLRDYVEAYRGVFMMDGKHGVEIGFDRNGLFITAGTDKQVRFRAMRLEQWVFEPGKPDGKVEFYNADTEERFVCHTSIRVEIPWPDGRWTNDDDKVNWAYPRLMEVVEREVGPEQYDYIVQPLIRLCKASVETGNPVAWC